MKIGPKQVPNAISQLLEGATQKKIYLGLSTFSRESFAGKQNFIRPLPHVRFNYRKLRGGSFI